MRIILTCNFSPWSAYSGGGQRSTHNLATALSGRGHDVTVVFTRARSEQSEPPAALPYALRWAGLLSFRGKSPGLWRLSSAPTIAQRVAELTRHGERAVVHSQGEEAFALPWLRRRRRSFGLVVTPRYPALPAAVMNWQASSLRDRLAVAYGDTKYLALGVALRGADYCCPPSAFGARLITTAYGLPAERVVPVHNGVPAEFLEHHWQPPADLAELQRRPALFFGRFSADKGADTIVDAIGRSNDARALLVGRGPMKEALAKRIAELDLGERVRFHEWADHHAIGRLLAQASVAILPSLDENFSLAVLSAMAVGTPLITTPVGGTAEVVKDQVNGRLVPSSDPAALARALHELRNNLQLTCEMGARGKALVREQFTWDRTAARFEEVYERTRQ